MDADRGDEALGIVDFSIFPHLDYPGWDTNTTGACALLGSRHRGPGLRDRRPERHRIVDGTVRDSGRALARPRLEGCFHEVGVRDLLCVVAGDLDNGPAEDAPVDLDLDPVRAGMDSPDRDVVESVFAREVNRLACGQVPDGQLEHSVRLGAADAPSEP
ncbi:MAG: hypothetical protein R2719_03890 [Micropruina sp.]